MNQREEIDLLLHGAIDNLPSIDSMDTGGLVMWASLQWYYHRKFAARRCRLLRPPTTLKLNVPDLSTILRLEAKNLYRIAEEFWERYSLIACDYRPRWFNSLHYQDPDDVPVHHQPLYMWSRDNEHLFRDELYGSIETYLDSKYSTVATSEFKEAFRVKYGVDFTYPYIDLYDKALSAYNDGLSI